MAEKKILAQDVADKIMDMIVSGRFAAGDQLPNENELARELAVSRSTLREASRMLGTYGFLRAERGRGTFVTAKAIEGRIRPELTDVPFDKAALRELYEVRLLLEPGAAALAAVRAEAGELAHIRAIHDEILTKIKAHADRTEEEQEFHTSIALAAHNSVLASLLPPMNKAILEGVRLSALYDRAVLETVQDHSAIVNFLCSRNAAGAETAMRLHILRAMDAMVLK